MLLLSVTSPPCTFILTQDGKQGLVQPISVSGDRQPLVGAATVGTKFLFLSPNSVELNKATAGCSKAD